MQQRETFFRESVNVVIFCCAFALNTNKSSSLLSLIVWYTSIPPGIGNGEKLHTDEDTPGNSPKKPPWKFHRTLDSHKLPYFKIVLFRNGNVMGLHAGLAHICCQITQIFFTRFSCFSHLTFQCTISMQVYLRVLYICS